MVSLECIPSPDFRGRLRVLDGNDTLTCRLSPLDWEARDLVYALPQDRITLEAFFLGWPSRLCLRVFREETDAFFFTWLFGPLFFLATIVLLPFLSLFPTLALPSPPTVR